MGDYDDEKRKRSAEEEEEDDLSFSDVDEEEEEDLEEERNAPQRKKKRTGGRSDLVLMEAEEDDDEEDEDEGDADDFLEGMLYCHMCLFRSALSLPCRGLLLLRRERAVKRVHFSPNLAMTSLGSVAPFAGLILGELTLFV